MSNTTNKYAPEVRERALRMVLGRVPINGIPKAARF